MLDTNRLVEHLEALRKDWDSRQVPAENAAAKASAIRTLDIVLTALPDFEIPTVQHNPNEVKPGVRANDPGTSWAAATADSKSRRDLYDKIYDTLKKYGPHTDDELRNRFDAEGFFYGHSDSVSKRRGELCQTGWVRKTSLRRPSNVGKSMIVWEHIPEQ